MRKQSTKKKGTIYNLERYKASKQRDIEVYSAIDYLIRKSKKYFIFAIIIGVLASVFEYYVCCDITGGLVWTCIAVYALILGFLMDRDLEELVRIAFSMIDSVNECIEDEKRKRKHD